MSSPITLPLIIFLPLILVMVVLGYFMATHFTNRLNRRFDRIEAVYIKPENIDDALVKILSLVDRLKAVASKNDKLPFWRSSDNKALFYAGMEKIDSHIKRFEESTREMADFLGTVKHDRQSAVMSLYRETLALLTEINDKLPDEERKKFTVPFYSILGLILRDFPFLLDHDEKEKLLVEIGIWREQARIPAAAGFRDVYDDIFQLKTLFREEPSGESRIILASLDRVEERIGRIEKFIGRVVSAGLKSSGYMEEKLEWYSRRFDAFKNGVLDSLSHSQQENIKSSLFDAAFTHLIHRTLDETVVIVNLMKLDYSRFTSVTAGLEKTVERYDAVLKSQVSTLQRQQEGLEQKINQSTRSMEEKVREVFHILSDQLDKRHEDVLEKLHTRMADLDAAADRKMALAAEKETALQQEKDRFGEDKNCFIQTLVDTVKGEVGQSVDMLRQTTGGILSGMDEQIKERDRCTEKFMETKVSEMVEKIGHRCSDLVDNLELEHDIREKQFDRYVIEKAQELKNASSSILNILNGRIKNVIDDFRSDFARLTEEEKMQITQQQENLARAAELLKFTLEERMKTVLKEMTGIRESFQEQLGLRNREIQESGKQLTTDLNNRIITIKTDFADLFKRHEDGFNAAKSNLDDILGRLNITADDKIKELRNAVIELYNQNDTGIKKTIEELIGIVDTLKNAPSSFFEKTREAIKEIAKENFGQLGVIQDKIEDILPVVEAKMENNLEVYAQKMADIINDIIHSCLKSIIPQADTREKMDGLIEYVNNTLFLHVSQEDVMDVLNRIRDEPSFSQEYRKLALSLLADLLHLRKDYDREWFWYYLAPVCRELKNSISLLYNEKGGNIYSSHNLDDEVLLASIKKEDLRQIINRQHWPQVWHPLLNWSRFLKAYFPGPLDDVWQVLEYNANKIVRFMENQLNYRVDHFRPLELVSADITGHDGVREARESMIFYRQLKEHVDKSETLKTMKEKLRNTPGKKLVAFVDQLGYENDGSRKSDSRLVLISPESREVNNDV